jgi:transposase-like protein
MVSTRNQIKQEEATTMKKVAKKEQRINRRILLQAMTDEQMHFEEEMTTIQTLIGLGMKAATEKIQKDFTALVGQRYEHGKPMGPWGSNRGSIYLGDQKVALRVPRARNAKTGEEGILPSYERLQSPQVIDDLALRRVINGISMRKYEEAALCVPETFGISRDSVSRRWIRASAKKLAALNERSLAAYDIVAIFLDGKHFSTDHEIVLALGITLSGEKVILGIIETSTENYVVCRDFIRRLIERGLRVDDPILCIIDGGKGLHKGLKEVLGDQAVIQRCQWHKRENVLKYLPKMRQDEFRRKLQGAYEQPTYEAARKTLEAIKRELKTINLSAVNSLEEGFDEILTLHRLGLFEKLGRSFKTTNVIENVNSLLGIYTDRVDYWKNSEQRQRWVATALLETEPRLRKVSGYQHLRQLRSAMAQWVGKRKTEVELKAAA